MSRTPKGLKGILWGRATTEAGFRVPCSWCGVPLTYQLATVDHEPPLAAGGTHRQAVLACDARNQERSKATNEAVKAKRRPKKRKGRRR